MLIDKSREKLINIIKYLVINTKQCNKIKLFKLLAFIDFEHFKETGRSITGLDYYAWPMGPVPKELDNELRTQPEDFKKNFLIKEKQNFNGNHAIDIISKSPFNEKVLTPREMRIVKHFSEIYRDAVANMMIESSHLQESPWDITYNQQKKKNEKIDFSLVLRNSGGISYEEADEIRKEKESLQRVFGNG